LYSTYFFPNGFIPKQKTHLKKYNDTLWFNFYLIEYETAESKASNLDDIVEILNTDELQELKMKEKDSLTIDVNV
jgi:hypothetical protein